MLYVSLHLFLLLLYHPTPHRDGINYFYLIFCIQKHKKKKEDENYIYFPPFDPFSYNLQKNPLITAADRKSTMPLNILIINLLRAMMRTVLKCINGFNKLAGFEEIDLRQIFWVIPIPILDVVHQKTLHQICRAAGMIHFDICLSPIATIYYILNTSKDFRIDENGEYLILECNANKTRIVSLNVESYDMSITYTNTIAIGSSCVTEAFADMLNKLLPDNILNSVQTKQPHQWMRQIEEFKMSMQTCPLELSDMWNVPFCFAISSKLGQLRKKIKTDPTYQNIENHVENYEIKDVTTGDKIQGAFKLGRSNLKINKQGWLHIAEPFLSTIVEFLSWTFINVTPDKIIVIGEFADNHYLVSRLSNEFKNKQFYIPIQSHLPATKGSLYYICESRKLPQYALTGTYANKADESSDDNNDTASDEEEKGYSIDIIVNSIITKAFVLIICIKSYDYRDDLPGTVVDKQNMITLWEKHYGYDILYNEADRVNKDDYFELMRKCRDVLSKKENKDKYDALFVIMSCHGNNAHVILSDNKKVERYKIMEWYNGDNVPFMSNKPKIIILDACRGHKDMHWGVANNNKKKQNKIVMKGEDDDIHHPDEQFMLVYSTTKGY
eukprot:470737_1